MGSILAGSAKLGEAVIGHNWGTMFANALHGEHTERLLEISRGADRTQPARLPATPRSTGSTKLICFGLIHEAEVFL